MNGASWDFNTLKTEASILQKPNMFGIGKKETKFLMLPHNNHMARFFSYDVKNL